MLKTTARILTGLISLTLSFCLVSSSVGQWPAGRSAAPANAGQSSGYRPGEARRRCDDLLGRSRQAMAENDLKSAETLVAQAEALGVEYGTLYRGDPPKKARRDLERTLKAAGSSPARPASR